MQKRGRLDYREYLESGEAHNLFLLVIGQLIDRFHWGPSQPSGGEQHCLYVVGGFLGYQWADFHCDFKMNFMCEYAVNPAMTWRRRRRSKINIWP